jgi:DNA polymerase-3 subunit epsilon
MALVLDHGDGSELITWEWLINPGCEIPLSATAIHGINTATAQEKGVPVSVAVKELAIALEETRIMCGETPPVCVYNAAYDVPILIRESNGTIGLDWQVLDGLVLDKMADTYRPGKRTLTAVSAAYGLGVANAHRAAGDAVSAVNVTRAIGKTHHLRAGNATVESLQREQALAYREQMGQFTEYKRTYGEPGFECPVAWPYDPLRLTFLTPP